MLQAIMPEPGRVEIREVERPMPRNGEVLLRIQRIGICGSDIHVFHGQHPLTPYPVIQGHEFSAIIEAIGPDVEGLEPGANVTALPQIVCGKCAACLAGQEHICHELKVQGFQAPGCAQEYWITNADKIIVLPDGMSYDAGAFVEPTAVGVHAINAISQIEGARVLVLGAGTIGNLLAQSVKASGADAIAIMDINEGRLDLAKKCGITECINPNKTSFEADIDRAFGEQGYNIIFDCAGVQSALTQSIAHLQKGGSFVVVAVYPKPVEVDLTLVQDRELKLIGTLMYQRPDYEKAIEFLAEKQVDIKPLISKHFALKDYASAYDYVLSKPDSVMKVLIDVGE